MPTKRRCWLRRLQRWRTRNYGYAKDQGDYAKQQGDYAKDEIDGAKGDFESLDARFDNTEENAMYFQRRVPRKTRSSSTSMTVLWLVLTSLSAT